MGYASQGYAPPPPAGYEQDHFAPRLDAQELWEEHHGYQAGNAAPATRNALVPQQHDELDEDFFGDEDEYEQEEEPRGGGRMKLVALLLVGSIAVAGGGIYLYKKMAGNTAVTFIPADNGPAKVAPGNPGGKQYPYGDKTIFERLTPEGQTVTTSPAASPPPLQMASPPAAPAPGGSSLEDRIDEALRKAQTRGGGSPASASGADRPTVVPRETYRPDGTRVEEGNRLVLEPKTVPAGAGGLPFGPPQQAQPTPPAWSPPQPTGPGPKNARRAVAKAEPAAPPAPAAAAPANGWYVSLRSSSDEKAI